MNCKEFKEEFAGMQILAFVNDAYTNIYKFSSQLITYFMRHFIVERHPFYQHVFFYECGHDNSPETIEKSMLLAEQQILHIKDKANFLYIFAKREDQKGPQCVFKKVIIPPDMSKLEGKRAKVFTIAAKS